MFVMLVNVSEFIKYKILYMWWGLVMKVKVNK